MFTQKRNDYPNKNGGQRKGNKKRDNDKPKFWSYDRVVLMDRGIQDLLDPAFQEAVKIELCNQGVEESRIDFPEIIKFYKDSLEPCNNMMLFVDSVYYDPSLGFYYKIVTTDLISDYPEKNTMGTFTFVMEANILIDNDMTPEKFHKHLCSPKGSRYTTVLVGRAIYKAIRDINTYFDGFEDQNAISGQREPFKVFEENYLATQTTNDRKPISKFGFYYLYLDDDSIVCKKYNKPETHNGLSVGDMVRFIHDSSNVVYLITDINKDRNEAELHEIRYIGSEKQTVTLDNLVKVSPEIYYNEFVSNYIAPRLNPKLKGGFSAPGMILKLILTHIVIHDYDYEIERVLLDNEYYLYFEDILKLYNSCVRFGKVLNDKRNYYLARGKAKDGRGQFLICKRVED